jgi:hypothetical protein
LLRMAELVDRALTEQRGINVKLALAERISITTICGLPVMKRGH